MTQTPRDSFDLQRLQQRLAGLKLGQPLYYFETIDSTNQFLRALPPNQIQPGALALADHQTKGRGRFHRRWCDTPGRSLLFSVLLEASRPASLWPLLTLGAAVSVCRALEREEIARPQIRWPNDVMIDERKVCGILAEKTSAPKVLVLGVGLNVHQRIEDFPSPLRRSAGSLQLAAERPWSRENLLVAFLADFETFYRQWRDEQDATILHECRRRMSTLGRQVYIHGHGCRAEGIVMDLDDDGSLVLREPTGIVSRRHSGEVEEIAWETKNKCEGSRLKDE